ncbi:MAG: threonine/serine exporter family protein [Tissierellia bacterium]|nr:threonine/serine exporter family protein [Tissierellia bacterium]
MINTINSEKEAMLLLEISTTACQMMLKNGAEIYRVEDTGERIVRSRKNIRDVGVYATFNVVIVSFNLNGEIYTNLKRVKIRENNLILVDKVNSFSREFVKGDKKLEVALKELLALKNQRGFSNQAKILGGSFAASLYAALFNGALLDIIISFIVAYISQYLTKKIESKNLSFFVNTFASGLLIGILAIIFHTINNDVNIDSVIIGALMPFVPGLAITNAVRDLMGGDTTSGITGSVNALLISLALAFGVALPISLYLKLW